MTTDGTADRSAGYRSVSEPLAIAATGCRTSCMFLARTSQRCITVSAAGGITCMTIPVRQPAPRTGQYNDHAQIERRLRRHTLDQATSWQPSQQPCKSCHASCDLFCHNCVRNITSSNSLAVCHWRPAGGRKLDGTATRRLERCISSIHTNAAMIC